MSRCALARILLLSAVLVLLTAPAVAYAAAIVQGTVSAGTPGSVGGIGVRLWASDRSTVVSSTIANGAGQFSFTVAPGQYFLSVDPTALNAATGSSWLPYWHQGTPLPGEADTVTAGDGVTTIANVTTYQTPLVRGRLLLNVYEDPAIGVDVIITTDSGSEVTRTVTASDGSWATGRLPQGHYHVFFDTDGYNVSHPGAHWLSDWYGDTAGGASPNGWGFDSGIGDAVVLMDQVLEVSRIQGMFGYADSTYGVGPVLVEAWSGGSVVATTMANSIGEFQLSPPPGTYTVRINPAAYNATHPEMIPYVPVWYRTGGASEPSTVTVNMYQPTSLLVSRIEPATRAVVLSTGGSYFPGAVMKLCTTEGMEVTRTVLGFDMAGAMILPEEYGDYLVYLDLEPINQANGTFYPSGWVYAPTHSLKPALSSATTFTVAPNQVAYPYVTIQNQANFRGSITDTSGAGVAGIDIELWRSNTRVATTTTSAEGTFSANVPAGSNCYVRIDASAYNAGPGSDLEDGWRYSADTVTAKTSATTYSAVIGVSQDVSTQLKDAYGVSGRLRLPSGSAAQYYPVYLHLSLAPEVVDPLVLPYDNAVLDFTYTDPQGWYRLRVNDQNVPDYVRPYIDEVTVEFVSYQPDSLTTYYQSALALDDALRLPAIPGVSASADDTLAVPNTVSGTVRNQAGAPLGSVNVYVYDSHGGVKSATTLANGTYSVTGLFPGPARVYFDSWSLNYKDGMYYPSPWWRNAADYETADILDVPLAATASSVDATLVEQVGGITGQATDGAAQPVESVNVYAYRFTGGAADDPANWVTQTSTQTNAQGDYAFARLPIGDYRVRFLPGNSGLASEWFNNARSASEATTVTVSVATTATATDAVLEVAGVVSGTVRDESGAGIPGLAIKAYTQSTWGGPPVFETATGADGSYRLTVDTPDAVRIVFGQSDRVGGSTYADARWFASEAFDNSSTFASATALTVAAGAEISADATLAACGSIAGAFKYDPGAGEYVAEAMLQDASGSWLVIGEASPTLSQDWDFTYNRMMTTGSYTLSNLVPGDYRVRIRRISGEFATKYYYSAATVESATPAAVTAGQPTPLSTMYLAKGGQITGSLKSPVSGARLYLYRNDTGSWSLCESVEANASTGDFRFNGVAAGQYTVLAYATDHHAVSWDGIQLGSTSSSPLLGYQPPNDVGTFAVKLGDTVPLANPITLQPTTALDKSAPVSACDAPAEWVNRDVVVHLSAVDAAGSPFRLYGAVGADGFQRRTVLPTITAEGVTQIRYYARDAFNNQEPTRTAEVRIDKTAPVTQTDALPGYRSLAVVRFFPLDTHSGPDVTHFSLDGGTEMIGTAVVSADTGTHTVRYWSSDRAGNTEAPRELTFVVGDDMVSPISTATVDSGWIKAPATVTLSAEDDNSGVSAIYYSTDGSAPRFVYYKPLSLVTHGLNVVTFQAQDRYANMEEPNSVEVWVDALSPVTTAQVAAKTSEATVTLVPTDEGAGVARTWFVLDEGAEESGTVVPIHEPGNHTVRYWSIDAVGNVEAHHEVTINVKEGTVVTAAPSAATLTYGQFFDINGTLRAAESAETSVKPLTVQVSANGVSGWSTAATLTTGPGGSYGRRFTPVDTAYYRVVFGGEQLLEPCFSPAFRITVRAKFTTPITPSIVGLNRTFTVSTRMSPRHATGTSKVTFRFERYESGRWVSRKTIGARNSYYNSTTTLVSGSTYLTLRGTWRVRAYHPLDTHPALYSTYRTFVVR